MPAAAPRRRGRPPGLEGRDLLAVAREELLAKGLRGTTMETVANRARISKQSLYAGYPSKDALFAAVVRDWVDQGRDAMTPHARALAESSDVASGLARLARVLQAGILSLPVQQMRALIAAEADRLPDVAADYATRSWDRNLRVLATALSELHDRGLLAVEDVDVAAEQFVWLVVAAPLNTLALRGAHHPLPDAELRRTATEAVTTFMSRFGT